jgi:peptidoglycan hydrolase-like protein with peptidoglycan-binding domain
MIKTHFNKELSISATQQKNAATNTKADVQKIQAWLNLFALKNPTAGTATGIDSDFGSATETAVINFQNTKGLPQTGIVDAELFSELCRPLSDAFQTQPTGNTLRELIISTGNIHVQNSPTELVINSQSNSGPWVRSYMDGNEGENMLWCMGFVQTIIDEAASQLGKDFRTVMPQTFGCDDVGRAGLKKGLLTRFTEVRNNPAKVKPGDIFLFQKTPDDWFHTGIIAAIHNDVFETIEGNTNAGGSSNGTIACKRSRNFMLSKLDVFSIEPLV